MPGFRGVWVVSRFDVREAPRRGAIGDLVGRARPRLLPKRGDLLGKVGRQLLRHRSSSTCCERQELPSGGRL